MKKRRENEKRKWRKELKSGVKKRNGKRREKKRKEKRREVKRRSEKRRKEKRITFFLCLSVQPNESDFQQRTEREAKISIQGK